MIVGASDLTREALQRAALGQVARPAVAEVERDETRPPIGTRIPHLADAGAKVVHAGLDGFTECRGFGLEVRVERPVRDTRGLRQPIDAQSTVAPAAKPTPGARQDPSAALLFSTDRMRHDNPPRDDRHFVLDRVTILTYPIVTVVMW